METHLNKHQKELQSQEALVNAEAAIHAECKKQKLEFAELSVTMRSLLAAVYIRGGLETLRRLREESLKELKK